MQGTDKSQADVLWNIGLMFVLLRAAIMVETSFISLDEFSAGTESTNKRKFSL
jgi:hypothetical protein